MHAFTKKLAALLANKQHKRLSFTHSVAVAVSVSNNCEQQRMFAHIQSRHTDTHACMEQAQTRKLDSWRPRSLSPTLSRLTLFLLLVFAALRESQSAAAAAATCAQTTRATKNTHTHACVSVCVCLCVSVFGICIEQPSSSSYSCYGREIVVVK